MLHKDFKTAVKDYIALHHAESVEEILNEVALDRRRMKHFTFHCYLRDVDAVQCLNWLKTQRK